MKKTTFLTKALTLLFVMLFSLTGARAEELTIYDGTSTNSYVPAYMNGWRWYYTKSQYIIPATELAAMNGCLITSVKFYTNNSGNRAYTTPNMTVYVKEVNQKYFNGTVTFETEGTTVYTGTLSVPRGTGEVTITFSMPFLYNGGDLLIGMGNTATNSNANISFYGRTSVNNVGCYGYSQNSQPTTTTNLVQFLPKTTFSYVCVTASQIGPDYATISWGNLADANGYNLRCRELVLYDDFKDLDKWTIYTNGDHVGEMQGWYVYGEKAASYGWDYINDDALNADNWLVSPRITLEGGDLQFDVLTDAAYSDRYEVVFATENTVAALTASTMVLRALAPATSGPVTIDLSTYAGQTGYIAIHHKSDADTDHDGSYLDIDNFRIYGDSEITRSSVQSPQTLTGLTTNTTYEAEVQAVYAQGESGWARTFFATTDNPIPSNVTVDPQVQTATINWDGISDSYEVRYRKAQGALTQGFEDNSFGDWTTIDADGDGYGWEISSTGYEPHSGTYLATSESYDNELGHALTPNNYLVSPRVALGGSISFWAKGQDSSWPYEVFGVGVSTTSNTDPATFTMVGGTKTATGVWTQYVFDLSAYSGYGYIAIRHYNCSDQFVLDIDDIVIREGGIWNTVTTTGTSVNLTGLVPNTDYEYTIIGIKDGVSNAGTPVATFTTLPGDFTVTVPSAGYTTFVAPFNISSLPVGLEAYACQANNSIAIHLEPVAAIPEGEAVVLKKEGTYKLTPASGSVELGTRNDLLPSYGNVKGGTGSGIYALAKKNSIVGFYPVGNDSNGNPVVVPAGKGYLVIPNSVKAFYGFDEDDATGIENVNVNLNDNEAIYNVAGQRLQKMQKGINIVNGKKILK